MFKTASLARLSYEFCFRHDAMIFSKFLPVSIIVTVTLAVTLGCATNPSQESAGGAAINDSPSPAGECTTSENLLKNPDFKVSEQQHWLYSQHAGETSFNTQVDDGVLEMFRTGPEPWMIYRQRVPLSVDSPAKLRLTAELKGQVSFDPPEHEWEHHAGLFMQLKPSSKSSVADHTPNRGVWDWQEVAVELDVPRHSTHAFVGFTHQGGGSLWARNPSLVLIVCEDAN